MKTSFLRGAVGLLLGLGIALPIGAAEKTVRPANSEAQAGKVDINKADSAALEALPEIGTDLANAIIAARPFKSVDDLERVPGIGPGKMKTLRNKVTASPLKASGAERYSGVRANTDTATPRAANRENDRAVAGAPTGRVSEERPRDASGRFISRADAAQRVDINNATKEQLEALPEIGPVKAQAIIDARPFSSPEDLKRVSGIKDATYDAIKDRIIVGRPSER
jgi:competence protein ComEA